MCGSMVDIQSAATEIGRGMKKDRKKPQDKNIVSASATHGGHKEGQLHVCVGSSTGSVERVP